jgi:MFS transporter, PAT family, beta-lactamase induction signal transducer AmpG
MLPNLLATRRGRLGAFFLLYTTEGVPLGFAAVAMATQLRRMGIGPAEIGAFVAAFYLPWAFKWAFGPMIDVFKSRRWGHRRAWILLTQCVMAATILMLLAVPLPQGLALFTGILLVHNTFAAMQDVAIDALAVNSLADDERGLANGLMFAGASVGQAVGGSGVLYLMAYAGTGAGIVLTAVSILAITTFVVLPMKEATAQALAVRAGDDGPPEPAATLRWAQAAAEMRAFAAQAFRTFLGSRAALTGVGFALLPAGAMSLSLALQSNLAVELGMTDAEVASLSLWTNLLSGAAMVAGGLMADRFGRRRMLGLFMAMQSVPVLLLAWLLWQQGYVMPRTPGGPPMESLITMLVVCTLLFNIPFGLMYGTRSAVMMDITDPRVAGTQFTSYMAMMNLAIAFAATWQGVAIEALGYPMTLVLDAVLGLCCLALLPWLQRPQAVDGGDPYCDARAERRARTVSAVLGVLCFGFVAWWLMHDPKGKWTDLVQTMATPIFVASALVLYASTLLQPLAPGLQRLCRVMAVVLLLLYLRRFIGPLAEALSGLVPAATTTAVLKGAVALAAAAAGALMLSFGRRQWPGLQGARAV